MASSSASVDRRRINGPASTSSPVYQQARRDAGPSSSFSPSIQAQQRTGADRLTTRPIFVQTGLVPQANGSAYLEAGNTKLACSVYGPRQGRNVGQRGYSDKAELNVDVRFAPFAGRRRRKPGKATESATLSALVHTALVPSLRLDLLPKASIDVFITVLESDAAGDGDALDNDDEQAEQSLGCASQAATVASAALADAGIEMWALVVGLTASFLGDNNSEKSDQLQADKILVDASASEVVGSQIRASMTLWTMPALGTVTAMAQYGGLDIDQVDVLLATLQKAATHVHFVVAKALQDGFTARRELLEKTQM